MDTHQIILPFAKLVTTNNLQVTHLSGADPEFFKRGGAKIKD